MKNTYETNYYKTYYYSINSTYFDYKTMIEMSECMSGRDIV